MIGLRSDKTLEAITLWRSFWDSLLPFDWLHHPCKVKLSEEVVSGSLALTWAAADCTRRRGARAPQGGKRCWQGGRAAPGGRRGGARGTAVLFPGRARWCSVEQWSHHNLGCWGNEKMTRNSAKLNFKVGRVTLSGRQPGLAMNGWCVCNYRDDSLNSWHFRSLLLIPECWLLINMRSKIPDVTWLVMLGNPFKVYQMFCNQTVLWLREQEYI